MLVECDPSIKSIIVNIDSENHDFIIEDLDEERVVVKENMVALLKQKLEDVRAPAPPPSIDWPLCVPHLHPITKALGRPTFVQLTYDYWKNANIESHNVAPQRKSSAHRRFGV